MSPVAAQKAHELPPLPYAYEALEPHIDSQTMQLHHDKHHATYVNTLNTNLEKHPDLFAKSAEDLLRGLSTVPEDIRTAVRNHGGGHVNHTMFSQIMGPDAGGEPTGAVGDEIKKTFGSFDEFKTKFNDSGAKQFGSGWVWLVRGNDSKLQVISTPNQDSPLLQGLWPIMGNDVWEHAYYLKYRNVRADYLKAWWNVVNWKEVERRFQKR